MASELRLGMRCIKYMLLVVNIMFMLTSVLLITVGTTIHAIYTDFHLFISGDWFSPAILLTAVGVLMFLIAFFGCCGAAKESTCMINMFGFMLAVVFCLEIASAITAFALQGDISRQLLWRLEKAMDNYPSSNAEMKDAVDFLQDRLNCCGINGPADWDELFDADIPASCCVKYQDSTWDAKALPLDNVSKAIQPLGYTTYELTSKNNSDPNEVCMPWPRGCYARLQYVISQSAMMLATGATAVALVQILGVIFAFMLAKAIRRAKTEREARRWQARMGHIMNLDAPYTQLSKADESKGTPVVYKPSSNSVA